MLLDKKLFVMFSKHTNEVTSWKHLNQINRKAISALARDYKNQVAAIKKQFAGQSSSKLMEETALLAALSTYEASSDLTHLEYTILAEDLFYEGAKKSSLFVLCTIGLASWIYVIHSLLSL